MIRHFIRTVAAIVMIAVVGSFANDVRGQDLDRRERKAEYVPVLGDFHRPVRLVHFEPSPKDSPMAEALKNGDNEKSERPRTLFSWNLLKDNKADDKDDDKNGGENKPSPIASDRPDFTENSSTVGLGRIQFEAGWTFTWDRSDGTSKQAHTYPELLIRAGLFAEWFELRIGQSWRTERTTTAGVVSKTAGAEDIYLGGRFMLTEQQRFLPEQSITFQVTLPSGGRDVSSRRALPGFNYTFSWEVNDFFGIAGSLGTNAANEIDDFNRPYTEWFFSMSTSYTLTKKLGAYAEFFTLAPHGARSSETVSQYYVDGGFQYSLTEDLAFDIRVGFGLNRQADDIFFGSGLVLRR